MGEQIGVKIGVIALAIEQAIDATLEPRTQRLKEDRDQARRQQGKEDVALELLA